MAATRRPVFSMSGLWPLLRFSMYGASVRGARPTWSMAASSTPPATTASTPAASRPRRASFAGVTRWP
ncbi:hypothetical protein ACEN9H_29660 [Massilia cellulosiltytica]|uniref:hypothetical protein n=1 Tax=Massilia cellulosiltytica TaxID=2683234 RepID=UPI0039B5597D